jgi:hypothetical protein
VLDSSSFAPIPTLLRRTCLHSASSILAVHIGCRTVCCTFVGNTWTTTLCYDIRTFTAVSSVAIPSVALLWEIHGPSPSVMTSEPSLPSVQLPYRLLHTNNPKIGRTTAITQHRSQFESRIEILSFAIWYQNPIIISVYAKKKS